MENGQKINCTVSTCRYNNKNEKKCMLESIQVSPTAETNTKLPDESMCASYKYEK